jgi:hypothetical protein
MKISVSLSRWSALQLANPLLALGALAADSRKSKALALEARGHQRERDRGRADERHDAEAFAVRRLDEGRARVGDRRAAGLESSPSARSSRSGCRAERALPITLM